MGLTRLMAQKMTEDTGRKDIVQFVQQRMTNGHHLVNGHPLHKPHMAHNGVTALDAAKTSPTLPHSYQPSPHTVPPLEGSLQSQTETQLALISSLLKTLTDNIRKPEGGQENPAYHPQYTQTREREYPDFAVLSQFPPPPLRHQLDIDHCSPSPPTNNGLSARHRPNRVST
jgi:hypothetical protein